MRTLLLLIALTSTALAEPPRSEVPLPDGKPGIGFDDLRFSTALGRVLAPAGRSGKLDLVDPKTRAVTPVGGFSSEAAAERGHDFGVTSADVGDGLVFATDRTAKRLAVIDPGARKIVGGASLAGEPDYVRWVAPTRELWVTQPDAERIEIFSAGRAPAHLAFVATPGGPESLVVDAARGRAYAHLWKGETIAINLKTRAIVARWKNGCEGSRGIALDERRGFLFVGCAEGAATTLDVSTGKLLGRVAAGAGVDIIDYAPARGRLYVPGGRAATLTVAAVDEKGGLRALGAVPTGPGAHCVAADDRGQAWVCLPRAGALLLVEDNF